MKTKFPYWQLVLLAFTITAACELPSPDTAHPGKKEQDITDAIERPAYIAFQEDGYQMRGDTALFAVIGMDVKVREYFPFMESLVCHYDTVLDYELTEHILVLANPWIIDTLESFDYYKRMAQGEFISDQKEMIALHAGDTLRIPNRAMAGQIQEQLAHTLIDVNIPEFRLRIIEYGEEKYSFPVRVGRDERKYLRMAGRVVDLRTPVGEGEIVRIEKDPDFIDPATGHHYYATRRDDGQYTRLPRIPWLEPSIGGKREGALIHPTTNESTLGKAFSNGCVGTPEGAAWRVYYHAPIGTKVHFRYQLEIINENGDTVYLKDIYHLKESTLSSTLPMY